MSGHSKWHSIRHQKGKADAKRGKLFSKLAKAITVAARTGGGDEAMNFALRLAIDKAKEANMPKDNIERAIARGTGEGTDADALETAVYDAMGPGGASLVVEVLTDNTNRSLTNVKTIINKGGGQFDAATLWQFERKGVVRVNDVDEVEDRDAVELLCIEAGAEDIHWNDGLEVISALSDLQSIEAAIREAGLKVASAEPEFVPNNTVALSEADEEKLMQLIDQLDDDEDVQNIYTNAQ